MPPMVSKSSLMSTRSWNSSVLGKSAKRRWLPLRESPAAPSPLTSARERERSALREPELYLSRHLDRLVILDDAHRLPDIVPVLRRLVERARQRGVRSGGYLIVGLAPLSRLNVRNGAGDEVVARLELTPLTVGEAYRLLGETSLVWVRGGLPKSLTAVDDVRSARWREDLIQTYLERDIRRIAPRLSEGGLGRCWKMLAHPPRRAVQRGGTRP